MIDGVPALTPEVFLRSALRDLRREAEILDDTEAARWAVSLDEHLRSRRLLVAVLGEHNRGKSTLINSVIGQAWLPVGQSTAPLPPIYVVGGAREHVELVYDDGSTAESTRDELLSQSTDEAASVSYARVALPSPELYGVVLADTPGLNDPDTMRLTQTVYGLLPHSDLALLVLDSTQALGASEVELIEQHIARAGLHRLVVVLNRDDELENDTQRTAVHERVVRVLTPILGNMPLILPYAARTALRARERTDTRLLARSGYPELRKLLQECAVERTHILQQMVAARARSTALTLRARAAAPLTAAAAGYEPELEETATHIGEARRTIVTLRDDYTLDVRAFAIGLRDRLAEEIAEAQAEDIRRFLPFYIRDQFAGFLAERESLVLVQAQQALRTAGLDQATLPKEIAGKPIAPGLHPFVAPDFLEDSVLITTFMQFIGLAIPAALMTALMTLGPLLRRYTRTIRTQDEHNALLQAAQAATIEAGTVLEQRIRTALDGIDEALYLTAATQPTLIVEELAPDPRRMEAVRHLDALVETLAALADEERIPRQLPPGA